MATSIDRGVVPFPSPMRWRTGDGVAVQQSGRAQRRQRPSPASLSSLHPRRSYCLQTRNWNSAKKSRSRRRCMQGTCGLGNAAQARKCQV